MRHHAQYGPYSTSSGGFNQHQHRTLMEARHARDPIKERTITAAQGIVVMLSSIPQVRFDELNWATH